LRLFHDPGGGVLGNAERFVEAARCIAGQGEDRVFVRQGIRFREDDARPVGQVVQPVRQGVKLGLSRFATAFARQPGEHALHDDEPFFAQEGDRSRRRQHFGGGRGRAVQHCRVQFRRGRIAHLGAHSQYLRAQAELIWPVQDVERGRAAAHGGAP
jgi:hypothetical protein